MNIASGFAMAVALNYLLTAGHHLTLSACAFIPVVASSVAFYNVPAVASLFPPALCPSLMLSPSISDSPLALAEPAFRPFCLGSLLSCPYMASEEAQILLPWRGESGGPGCV